MVSYQGAESFFEKVPVRLCIRCNLEEIREALEIGVALFEIRAVNSREGVRCSYKKFCEHFYEKSFSYSLTVPGKGKVFRQAYWVNYSVLV